MKLTTLFIILFILFNSCKINNKIETKEKNKISSDSSHTNFITLCKGSLSGGENISFEQTLIDNENSWRELKTKLNTINKTTLNCSDTVINFNNSNIISVISEVKRTGGYDVEIVKTIELNDTLIIHIKNTAPKPKEMVSTAITQPFHIIKISKTNNPIVFLNL